MLMLRQAARHRFFYKVKQTKKTSCPCRASILLRKGFVCDSSNTYSSVMKEYSVCVCAVFSRVIKNRLTLGDKRLQTS